MHTHEPPVQGHPAAGSGTRASRRAWWVFGGFAAFGVILVALEHRAHLAGWLPWIILLACPLMHIFMHGGHGGHNGSQPKDDEK